MKKENIFKRFKNFVKFVFDKSYTMEQLKAEDEMILDEARRLNCISEKKREKLRQKQLESKI